MNCNDLKKNIRGFYAEKEKKKKLFFLKNTGFGKLFSEVPRPDSGFCSCPGVNRRETT